MYVDLLTYVIMYHDKNIGEYKKTKLYPCNKSGKTGQVFIQHVQMFLFYVFYSF